MAACPKNGNVLSYRNAAMFRPVTVDSRFIASLLSADNTHDSLCVVKGFLNHKVELCFEIAYIWFSLAGPAFRPAGAQLRIFLVESLGHRQGV